jgi:hypothetical protein
MNLAGSFMTHCLRRFVLGFSLAAIFALAGPPAPQQSGEYAGERNDAVRLPSGKLQSDEILKAEREQNIKDAARMAELTQQLQQDLEKNDYTVLSISTLRKTEDIGKLARKIHDRLRHY